MESICMTLIVTHCEYNRWFSNEYEMLTLSLLYLRPTEVSFWLFIDVRVQKLVEGSRMTPA